MSTTLPSLLSRLTWLLAPGRCVLCGLASHRQRDLCDVCEADLPALLDPCPRCALPLASGVSGLCGPCLLRPPRYLSLTAACSYQDPADLLVQALKFRRLRPAARVMAEVMYERLPATSLPREAWLLPVPLHPWRQWQRGFNQSVLIAQELARLGGWRMLSRAVRRRRATRPQSGLNRAGRRRNLANAFEARPGRVPEQVIIVDDVVTTGTTLDALTRTLLRAGAREVHAWAFARTPP
ncbi:MAG: ComF family protein [Gammaproteobacteria bacterium]|nr:ComF family protein [Gammaproteobacteria bacterium]